MTGNNSDDRFPSGVPYQPLKVKLREDWYKCTNTVADLFFQEAGSTHDGIIWNANDVPGVPLDDPSGMIKWDMGADVDDNGDLFIPKGFICLVARPQDAFDGLYSGSGLHFQQRLHVPVKFPHESLLGAVDAYDL